MFPVLKTPT